MRSAISRLSCVRSFAGRSAFGGLSVAHSAFGRFPVLLYTMVLSVTAIRVTAQQVYSLDASAVRTDVSYGYFKMGSPGPAGKEVLVNSRYLTIGGLPCIPVMGELQFSRMPKERWEDEILKMKACGVNIISTYVFWIHHEEIEGRFDWSGNRDLRSFVQLCQRLGMLVYPRIGPWAHGEARNGGTPDWILRKKYLTDRSLDPVYMHYVDRYYGEIGRQLQGLMYKDGGPVVGIQLENEYWKGKAGEPYIFRLKQTALKYGMDVPLYTVTGWGDGSVPPGEVIPLWGGYPDESWAPDISKITNCDNYTFNSFRNDSTIGNAQAKPKDVYMDYGQYPYFTCEMGVGIFNSIHRRPVIGPLDGLGLAVSRIGSGGNLLGYYVFAGGSNPLGIYSTMQEDKEETGYWSELSPISYDFQAAIKENGMPSAAYYEIKRVNYFLNQFGSRLAPMEPAFKLNKGGDLQYAARVKDNSGFLFGIRYCRGHEYPGTRLAQFRIKLKDQTLLFPAAPVNIPDSSLFIWPFNFDMDGTRLIYATAQPLFTSAPSGHVTSSAQPVWVFMQDANLLPEMCFEETGIEKIDLPRGKGEVIRAGHTYTLSRLHPGTDCVITVTKKDGSSQKIVLLSREEGKRTWLLRDSAGEQQLYLSRSVLYMKDNQLSVIDTLPDMEVKRLSPEAGALSPDAKRLSPRADQLFTTTDYRLKPQTPPAILQREGALKDASWLVTSVKSIDPGTLLYHREFQKEFSADDPAQIKSAKLILAPESDCRVRINDKWCDQPIIPGTLNVLDITGYVNKGDNVLLLDFPFATGNKTARTAVAAFAARVLVEYFNTDRLDFTTDPSWLTFDSYYFPATYGSKPVYPITYAAPEIARVATETPRDAADAEQEVMSARRAISRQPLPGFSEWTLPIPCNYLEGLNNLYLAVRYKGDRISARLHDQLIADNLNNNTEWLMDLKRPGAELECQNLELEVRPWKNIDKMYFDRAPASSDEGKAAIENIRFIPEYKMVAPVAEEPVANKPVAGESMADEPPGAESPRDWKDTDGHFINAHGAGILTYDGTYYLFGEIKKGKTYLVPDQSWEDYRVEAGGISCYSSKDLIHWKYLGVALAPETSDTSSDLYTDRVIERPKVLYNRETGKFIMWMHIDRSDYSYARAGVAVSDKPQGPYRYIGSVRPNGQMSRDMTAFGDDNGKAYLVYTSENNNTLHVTPLSGDYLSVTPAFNRILVGQRREAPAVFKQDGKYYLITSLCSGWDPNAATYAMADSMMGDWEQQGNPCVGEDAATTFHSQSAFVLPLKDKNNSFIFMADKWNKTDLENSGYLWLPLEVNESKVVIKQ
jgi:hypothetical protein